MGSIRLSRFLEDNKREALLQPRNTQNTRVPLSTYLRLLRGKVVDRNDCQSGLEDTLIVIRMIVLCIHW